MASQTQMEPLAFLDRSSPQRTHQAYLNICRLARASAPIRDAQGFTIKVVKVILIWVRNVVEILNSRGFGFSWRSSLGYIAFGCADVAGHIQGLPNAMR